MGDGEEDGKDGLHCDSDDDMIFCLLIGLDWIVGLFQDFRFPKSDED